MATAALLVPSADLAAASDIILSNGPNVVRGKKLGGGGNAVTLVTITAIPNATSVDVYMAVGPDTHNPYDRSSMKYDQEVNSIPDLRAFSGYAANNWIDVRGNHYYSADVSGVSPVYK